jgi:putative ABC transport system substrate-binding protein
VRTPDEFAGAFAAATSGRAEALLVMPDTFLLHGNRTRIVDLAQRHRLPGMYPDRAYVDAGGLIFYGDNWKALFPRAATYVDKLLKGAKPADLPVEQPMKVSWSSTSRPPRRWGSRCPPPCSSLQGEVF